YPVDSGAGSYGTILNAYKRITAGCSASERRAIFSTTAIDVYRLALADALAALAHDFFTTELTESTERNVSFSFSSVCLVVFRNPLNEQEPVMTRASSISSVIPPIVIAVLLAASGAVPAFADGSPSAAAADDESGSDRELAKKLVNPLTDMVSV